MNSNLAMVLPQEDEASSVMLPDREQQLPELERTAKALIPSDDETEEAATLFISKCKQNEKDLDAERKAQTDPLNAQIKAISAPYKKVIEAFEALRKNVEWRLDDYRTRKALAQAAEQRRLIDEANKKQADELRKAEDARVAAEAARAAGNIKEATKLESKAEKAELKAATVEIPVLETVKKTVALEDGSKVTFKSVNDWMIPGLDKTQPMYRDDVRLKAIPDEYFVLDTMQISKIVRAGGKVPGVTIFAKSTTSVRGAK